MSRRGGQQSIEFDLNLAPIIDCFTVLITFLLVSASFLSVSLFDAGFTPVEQMGDTNPPPITVQVMIEGDEKFVLDVKGKLNQKVSFKTRQELVEGIKAVQEKFPKVDSLTMTASDAVEYEAIVQTMESVRPYMPAIVLGGY